jgi:hypothetical protein
MHSCVTASTRFIQPRGTISLDSAHFGAGEGLATTAAIYSMWGIGSQLEDDGESVIACGRVGDLF